MSGLSSGNGRGSRSANGACSARLPAAKVPYGIGIGQGAMRGSSAGSASADPETPAMSDASSGDLGGAKVKYLYNCIDLGVLRHGEVIALGPG